MKLSKTLALLVSMLLAVSLCSIGVAAATAKASTGSASITFYSETPTIPVIPTDPTNPTNPVDPTDPTNPTNPTNPSTPGSSGSGSNSGGGSSVRDGVRTNGTTTIRDGETPLVSIVDPETPLTSLGKLPKTGGDLLLPLLFIIAGAAFLITALRSRTGQVPGQTAAS